MTISTGLPEHNGCVVDFIEEDAEVEAKMPLHRKTFTNSFCMMRAGCQTGNVPRPMHSILSLVYRELTGRVIIVIAMMRRSLADVELHT